MIAGEAEATDLAQRLDEYAERVTSALAFWETAAGLCRSYGYSPEQAHDSVRHFVDARTIRINPVSYADTKEALVAFARFGKGRHPAALNMGDCFAYAGARVAGADLLYKGEDFAQTDLG